MGERRMTARELATQAVDKPHWKRDGGSKFVMHASISDVITDVTAAIEARDAASEAREAVLVAALETQIGIWESLLGDLESARVYAENRGGQQAGIPAMICTPPSTRYQLTRQGKDAIHHARAALASPRGSAPVTPGGGG
jgi:hypothetical protein